MCRHMPMLMLNRFILKSAPLDLRLPVSSLFVVCLIVPYRNPATPNETLVLMLFMINTQNPGFNPNLISDVVVLVFFNDSSLPLTKRFEPLEKANSVSLKKPKRLFCRFRYMPYGIERPRRSRPNSVYRPN